MQGKPETTRCAIYTRVSTEEQAREGYSLAAQDERLRSHAKSQGWAVYKLYCDDGYSAASRKRPALKRLLADATLGRFDVVLAYKIDRLSRSLKDLLDIVAELNESKVGFKSCTEMIDTTRPEGRLMFHQFGSFAQYERELIGQRTRFGMMKRLKQGLWNGIPPYGYRLDDGKLAIEPAEARWVKQIFDWYLTKNMGVVAISRELNERGVTTRRGERWKGGRVHKLITNPLYAGSIRWGGEMAEGVHEPIIDRATWDQVERTRRDRGPRNRQMRSPNYLSGLVTCGLCGAAMHVTYPGAQDKRRFKYYVCNNRLNHRSCRQDYIRADVLEHSVVAEIAKLAQQREVMGKLVADFVAGTRKELPDLERQREDLQAQMAALQTQKATISQLVIADGLNPQAIRLINDQAALLVDQENELQGRLWGLEDRITGLQTTSYNAATICDALAEFARQVPELQPGERRLVVESVVQRVTVQKQRGVVLTLRPPLTSFGFLSTQLAPRGVEPLFEE